MEMQSAESKTTTRRVGLLYDERMCKHHTPDGDHHPENPNRIKAIWYKLQKAGIPQRCVLLNAKEAEDKYILSVHSKNHVNLIRNVSSKQFDSRRNRIASNFNSIYLNEGSSEAAYLATGSVIELVDRVAKGELNSAFAVVRPPGHHAEQDKAMGFCLYNNVAIAASFLLNERPELGINKILIVDWDVHHGNGTQKMFWKDPRVLFFSVHRHEFGSFYPANDDGFYTMIGEGPGAGYNINVPWENGKCGDADYLAVWDHILVPVAKEFAPDIILVSAGFDAAVGDPLGGCCVTPYGYSVMLKKLMDFAQGKVVLALEGGYNLESISNSVLACMEVLLEYKPISGSSEAYPFESTWRVIRVVRHKLSAFWPTLADDWPTLADELPTELTSKKAPLADMISSSDSEDKYEKTPAVVPEAVLEDVIEPLLKLKVEDGHAEVATKSATWRSELAKVDVWYASFGSNMWKPRFLCYIQGGQVEGMKKACSGSMDRNPPKETLWKTFPHRLFFGLDSTCTWGPGGVAFLNPESDNQEKTYLCLYRITLEQYNDVLLQENSPTNEKYSPFLDITALNSIADKKSICLEALKKGWYHNVVYLGKERDIPILTMTCSLSDVEGFKSGKLPLRAPAVEYANVLIRGLVDGGQLSEKEAMAYIQEASTKRLRVPSLYHCFNFCK
ncbi:histone deacetylase 5-like isoform X2 [Mangifera indica]|uniref:histone deacetylase 5-like isoform X2 n=1 Tax=Mangifera indica TaxID=29780 RepID=UPI001CFAE4DD|nr:histone deacetylase 5-like isoform X2 [Mangifera indica]